MWTHANTTASINDINSLGYNSVLFLLLHLTRVALYECCIINQQSDERIPCTQSQCIYTIHNCNIILRIVLILIIHRQILSVAMIGYGSLFHF